MGLSQRAPSAERPAPGSRSTDRPQRTRLAPGRFDRVDPAADLPAVGCLHQREDVRPAVGELAIEVEVVTGGERGNRAGDVHLRAPHPLEHGRLLRGQAVGERLQGAPARRRRGVGLADRLELAVGDHQGQRLGGILGGHGIEQRLHRGGDRRFLGVSCAGLGPRVPRSAERHPEAERCRRGGHSQAVRHEASRSFWSRVAAVSIVIAVYRTITITSQRTIPMGALVTT